MSQNARALLGAAIAIVIAASGGAIPALMLHGRRPYREGTAFAVFIAHLAAAAAVAWVSVL